ncbi:MAG: ATP-binding protein [Acidobacteria bacterium]|nr:ATP-binding protein [Acidobacteriota bacterium]
MTPRLNLGSVELRPQANRFVGKIVPEGSAFRGVLLASRGEGKTDFLRQVHAHLFDMPEGPIAFLFDFPREAQEDTLARLFLASFCQQVRAFLMRREELLWEPASPLEQELERPGLPLSLTELLRTFLNVPAASRAAFAATFPAQFASREKRPVCLLFDDAERLDRSSPFFAGMNSPELCWFLTGQQPFLRSLAGERMWPVLHLEPFTPEAGLGLAEMKCRESGLAFSAQAWTEWFEVAGTSPWLVAGMVQAAASGQHLMGSIEEVGRVYVQELDNGTLGNSLATRWQQAIPDRRYRWRVAQVLSDLINRGLTRLDASLFPAEICDGLVREEWVEENATGLSLRLSTAEQDWLWLTLARASGGSAVRSQARALQTFLFRAGQNRQRRQDHLLYAIRQRILELPNVSRPALVEWEGAAIPMPRVCSVTLDRAGSAELFWCYGFLALSAGKTDSPCIFLIVLCEVVPSPEDIRAWRRQLEQEARLLPAATAMATAPELWVVGPPDASLVSGGPERLFSWESFLFLLESDRASASQPPMV